MGREIFLWGYWGGFNVGDELILRALLDIVGRDNAVVVARGDAKWISRLHNVESIPYHKALPLVSSHRHIIGGGGLFQDSTSIYNILYYLYPIVFGRSSILLGVGIGPLTHKLSQYIVSDILRGVSFASVRDSLSYRFLRYTVGLEGVVMLPDLVFTLSQLYPINSTNNSDDSFDLFIPGPAVGRKWYSIKDKLRETTIVVEFLPQRDKVFRDLYPSSWRVINGIDALVSGELWDILKEANRWVSGRLHGVVLACLMGTRFYSVVYDPKMIMLMRDYCQGADFYGGYVNIDITEIHRLRKRARVGYKSIVKKFVEEGWA